MRWPWWYWTRRVGEERWQFHLALPWGKRARWVRLVNRDIDKRAAEHREQIERMLERP